METELERLHVCVLTPMYANIYPQPTHSTQHTLYYIQ